MTRIRFEEAAVFKAPLSAGGPPGYMLGDGPIFESDIESMEIGDCEAPRVRVRLPLLGA